MCPQHARECHDEGRQIEDTDHAAHRSAERDPIWEKPMASWAASAGGASIRAAMAKAP